MRRLYNAVCKWIEADAEVRGIDPGVGPEGAFSDVSVAEDHTMPHRTIRVPDDLWKPFIETAKANGTDASTVLRQLIAGWLEDQKEQK